MDKPGLAGSKLPAQEDPEPAKPGLSMAPRGAEVAEYHCLGCCAPSGSVLE